MIINKKDLVMINLMQDARFLNYEDETMNTSECLDNLKESSLSLFWVVKKHYFLWMKIFVYAS